MGFYPDGKVGEIFIEAEKQGSTIGGMLGAFAKSVSIGLQYGIPIEHFTQSFKYLRFAPEGFTDHEVVRNVSSIMDYIFKYLEYKLDNGYFAELLPEKEPVVEDVSPVVISTAEKRQDQSRISQPHTSDPSYPETKASDRPAPSAIAISCKSDS